MQKLGPKRTCRNVEIWTQTYKSECRNLTKTYKTKCRNQNKTYIVQMEKFRLKHTCQNLEIQLKRTIPNVEIGTKNVEQFGPPVASLCTGGCRCVGDISTF